MSRKEPLDRRYTDNSISLDTAWAEEALREAKERVDRLLPRFSEQFPSANTIKGSYEPVEKVDWTEGFWTGMLWLLYEVFGEKKYRERAETFLPQFQDIDGARK